MVKTASTMLPLGTKAPDFSLVNVDGQVVSLGDFEEASALLMIFMCNHCPFVQHLADELASLAREFQAQGVGVVGINSNDVSTHPGDSPEQMVHAVEERGYTFPYLYDENQQVAKAYQASCTPDFYVFDGDLNLVYRGQFDDSRPDLNIPITGSDLRAALAAVLAGQPVSSMQKPSIGCNIKWIQNAEPDYFDPQGVS